MKSRFKEIALCANQDKDRKSRLKQILPRHYKKPLIEMFVNFYKGDKLRLNYILKQNNLMLIIKFNIGFNITRVYSSHQKKRALKTFFPKRKRLMGYLQIEEVRGLLTFLCDDCQAFQNPKQKQHRQHKYPKMRQIPISESSHLLE